MDAAQKIVIDGLVEIVRAKLAQQGELPGTSTASQYRHLFEKLFGQLMDAEELKVEDCELKAALGMVMALLAFMIGRGWPVADTFGALLDRNYAAISEILERHNRSKA